MRRRTFLAALAGGLAGLAGCAGSGPSSPGGTPTDEESPTDTPTPTPSPTPTPMPTPTLAGQEFAPMARCPDDATDGAAVAFDEADGAVSVRGCLRGRNGCARAALPGDGVTYDADAGVLHVRVHTVVETDEDTVCTQAITPRGYEATARFEGGLPGVVAVVHDDVDGRREVARVER